jgi:uncharacterized membrane protein
LIVRPLIFVFQVWYIVVLIAIQQYNAMLGYRREIHVVQINDKSSSKEDMTKFAYEIMGVHFFLSTLYLVVIMYALVGKFTNELCTLNRRNKGLKLNCRCITVKNKKKCSNILLVRRPTSIVIMHIGSY